jgi:hypothetical protein
MENWSREQFIRRLVWMSLTLILVGVVTLLSPLEKTLGTNVRLVYLHGAWVWTGMVIFALSGISGLLGLLIRRRGWSGWSQVMARTGMVFWLTNLPMSLLIMQINWGGFFLEEPRWQIPLNFALVGIMLQVGAALINRPVLTSALNVIFGIGLWWSLLNVRSVLHPDSPIFGSGSTRVQLFFGGLVVLSLIFGVQLAFLFRKASKRYWTESQRDWR